MSDGERGNRDVSMEDMSRALDEVHEVEHRDMPMRRRSTLILTEENEKEADIGHIERAGGGEEAMNVDQEQSKGKEEFERTSQKEQPVAPKERRMSVTTEPEMTATVPIRLRWVQSGNRVYVTGSFTGWRKMIGLAKQGENDFLLILGLPAGTHRFRFVVDNELRFSDYLPTATDLMGNFVNYIEVTPEQVKQYVEEQEYLAGKQDAAERFYLLEELLRSPTGDKSFKSFYLLEEADLGYYSHNDSLGEPKPPKLEYINSIPPIFVDPKVMEQYYMAIDKQLKSSNGQQQAWLFPPQLPPHLETVVLNKYSTNDKDNEIGALPIPNHVVLNHLATTSIKQNTLAVASIVRYKRKYVTQILYAPLDQKNNK